MKVFDRAPNLAGCQIINYAVRTASWCGTDFDAGVVVSDEPTLLRFIINFIRAACRCRPTASG